MLQRTTVLGLASVLALGVSALPQASMAAGDPLIEGARQCTQYFPVEEKKNAIPTHLLAAIATTESGRYHEGLGMSVPWPWTINVEGKGYYFNSKAEAIAQVQNLLAKGVQSIDVGCMQVNLKHHPKAFANLNEAFDPSTNVAYAAKFLHDNYATLGDWIKATAAYHSRTPVYGQRYLVDIERSWNRIVGKVAAARAGKGAGSTQMAAGIGSTKASDVKIVGAEKPVVVASAAPTSPAMQPAHRARVISVSDATERRNKSEVVVVRAEKPTPTSPAAMAAVEPAQSKPVTVAEAEPQITQAPLSTPAAFQPGTGDSVRRVSLDNTASSAVPKASGPNYIFAN